MNESTEEDIKQEVIAKPKPEYFALFREFNCKKLNKKKQDK